MRTASVAIMTALVACTSAPEPSVRARMRLPADEYFASPWPDDRRLDEKGCFLASEFPNPHGAGIFEEVKRRSDGLSCGWSIAAPAYMPFDGALDTSTLPTEPAAFMSSRAPFFMVAIDQGGPFEGLQVPLEWRFDDAPNAWLPGNVLIARPVRGFTLESGTRYAFVVTTRLVDRAGVPIGADAGFAAALAGEGDPAWADHLRPLRTFLESRGIDRSLIAGATVFTTATGQAELLALRDWVEAQPAPVAQGLSWDSSVDAPEGTALVKGTYEAPYFLHGAAPYTTEGGEFDYEANGTPRPSLREQMRFSLCLPTSPMPDKGFPVVFVSHGTGGDWHSFVRDGTCGRLAAKGIASFGIDNVLHGPRARGATDCIGMPAENCFFNPVNPVSSRNLMRQAALDHVSLRRMVEGLSVPVAVAGLDLPARFDLTHPGFFGHSQGGLTGALYLAIEKKSAGGMLSGAGGHLTTTLLDRVDTNGLSSSVRALAEGLLFGMREEHLDQLHPGMAILQTIGEPADPLLYAKGWLREPQGRRKSVLLINGTEDPNTPLGCAVAYAVRGGVPQFETGRVEDPLFELAGLLPVAGPVTENVPVQGDWPAVTAAFREFPGAGHFPAFDDASAVAAWTTFLDTLVHAGVPTVPAP